MKPKEQQTPEDLKNEAFKQNKLEAFGLQLKEESGTITPVEQERLGVLQAKMNDFWAQRLQRASRSGFDISKVSFAPREGQATPQLQPMWRKGRLGEEKEGQRSPLSSPQQSLVSPLQAKLTIGKPGDQYEQEADRVASQVVEQINSPDAAQSTQGQSVQRQEEPEEELQAKPEITPLQRQEEKPEELKAKSTLKRGEEIAVGEASEDLESAINRARGSGQPLDRGLQAQMGQAMGADFSGVRVHTDTQSHELNQSIQAKAFTTGQDVFFRSGAYDPGSRGGQELLAHELTHVVQQKGGHLQRTTLQRNGGGEATPFDGWEMILYYAIIRVLPQALGIVVNSVYDHLVRQPDVAQQSREVAQKAKTEDEEKEEAKKELATNIKEKVLQKAKARVEEKPNSNKKTGRKKLGIPKEDAQRPQLYVQQGPSCWLYVLEALLKAHGKETQAIGHIMRSYPSSDDIDDKRRAEKSKGKGKDITRRGAATLLIADRLSGLNDKLDNYQNSQPNAQHISKEVFHTMVKRSAVSTTIVEKFDWDNYEEAAIKELKEVVSRVQEKARKLAALVRVEKDDVGSLLQTGTMIIEPKQGEQDVHITLEQFHLNKQYPLYMRIFKGFKVEKKEDRGAKTLDYTRRKDGEMEERNHAVLLTGYKPALRQVTYKDPNYGDVEITITNEQLQKMGGGKNVLLRPFMTGLKSQSKLAELTD
jgi:hypothetical protein